MKQQQRDIETKIEAATKKAQGMTQKVTKLKKSVSFLFTRIDKSAHV